MQRKKCPTKTQGNVECNERVCINHLPSALSQATSEMSPGPHLIQIPSKAYGCPRCVFARKPGALTFVIGIKGCTNWSAWRHICWCTSRRAKRQGSCNHTTTHGRVCGYKGLRGDWHLVKQRRSQDVGHQLNVQE